MKEFDIIVSNFESEVTRLAKVKENVKTSSRNPNTGVSVWDLQVVENEPGENSVQDPMIAELTKHHRMHNHVFNEIVMVVRGEANIVSMNDGISIKAPFLVVYPEGVPHVQINNYEHGYKRYLVNCFDEFFSRCGLSSEEYDAIANERQVYAIQLDEREKEILEAICNLIMTFNEEEVEAKEQMIAMLIRRVAKLKCRENLLRESDVVNFGKHYFGSLLKYIAENCSDKLSLGTLASTFYVSRTKLATDFNEVMGMSVGEYVLKVRIDRAKVKLYEGRTISEVAYDCGFASTSYFIQSFKKIMGITPKQYIEEVRIKKNKELIDYQKTEFDDNNMGFYSSNYRKMSK